MDKIFLDYGRIKKDINILIQYFPNTIKRDNKLPIWKQNGDLRHVLYGFTKIAGIYFDGVIHLTGDAKHNEYIKPEYQLCAGPHLRVLLEILTNLIFIKDDLHGNVRRYIGTGILDKIDEISFFEKQGSEWEKLVAGGKDVIRKWMKQGNFSENQLNEVKKFPNLSSMRRSDKTPKLSKESREFIIFIHDWYYPWLSRMGHVTLSGMAHMLSHLEELEAEKTIREEAIQGAQSYSTFLALSLLLAIFTETFDVIGSGDKQKLLNLWIILCEYSPDVTRIFERRYKQFLT